MMKTQAPQPEDKGCGACVLWLQEVRLFLRLDIQLHRFDHVLGL